MATRASGDTPSRSSPPEKEPESHTEGRYRFTGPYPQIYLDRSLLVEPGETYDWPDGAPADGKWTKES